MTVGEVRSGPPDIGKYYQGGKGLDMCFDFPYHDAAKHAVESLRQQAREIGRQVVALVGAGEDPCLQGGAFLW